MHIAALAQTAFAGCIVLAGCSSSSQSAQEKTNPDTQEATYTMSIGHLNSTAHVLAFVAQNEGFSPMRAPAMLGRIMLPSALPLIFNGLNIGLTLSFILPATAEMIGCKKGWATV